MWDHHACDKGPEKEGNLQLQVLTMTGKYKIMQAVDV